MHIYDRFARIAAILLLVFALHGCGGDDSGPADRECQVVCVNGFHVRGSLSSKRMAN